MLQSTAICSETSPRWRFVALVLAVLTPRGANAEAAGATAAEVSRDEPVLSFWKCGLDPRAGCLHANGSEEVL